MVRRADHVEVEVQGDLVALGLRQVVHVVRGADEVGLLRTPESEPDLVRHGDLRNLLGDLEDRRRPAAVVVDAGTGVDRVQVGANHHDVVRIASGRLGEDVVGRRDAAQRLGLEMEHQPRRRRQLHTERLGDARDRDVQREGVAQRAVQRAGNVVVDHHADRSGVVRRSSP